MHKRIFRLACSFLLMLMLSACGSNDEPIIQPDVPTAMEQPVCFSFSLQEGEEQVTRAEESSSCTRVSADIFSTRATTPLNQNFIVYGYKTLSASEQPVVFPGYNVIYTPSSAGTSEDNTHNYSYVNPNDKQYIKYWDYTATEYCYWGYVPRSDNKISATDDGREIAIEGLQIQITEPTGYLVSRLKIVPKAVFGNVVQLQFRRPYAQVFVKIYSGQNLEDSDVIELSQITFGPTDSSVKIPTAATVKVSYPLSAETEEAYTVTQTSSTDVLTYHGFADGNVLHLTSAHCASNTAAIAYPNEAVDSSTPSYFVLPLGSADPVDFRFCVSVDGDEDLQSAIVPAIYMNWQPNHTYTYVFKILEGGLIFVDAQVQEWQSGGTGSDTWPNW